MALSPAPLSEAGLPRDVYALLAQANLLRMRGCWEEAVQNCMAAMRLAPESPAAQSLLGDIYENQGRHDDAIQWYRMALDIHPDSPADQMKLERLLRLQQNVAPRASAAALPPETPRGSFPRLNPETTLRYAALLSALIVLLIVAFAYISVHRQAALAAMGLASPNQEMETKPVVVPSSNPLTPQAGLAGNLHDATEQTLLNALNASQDLSAQGITVYDVQTDPRASSIAITFSVTPTAGVVLSREAVLRAALRTIQAAASIPGGQSASAFTARCLLAPGGVSGAALVFAGDIPRSAVPADVSADAGLNAAQVQALFGNPWWSPQITG